MLRKEKPSLTGNIKEKLKNLNLRKNAKNNKSFGSSKDVLDCLIAYNDFGGYCVPISSQQRRAAQMVLNGQVYEPDTIDFMRKNCKDGDIVHAGTYFGDFLPGISKGLSGEATIWSFEPNYENFKCAQITLLINGIENVKLANAGLGESSSNQKLLIRTDKGVNMGGASKIVGDDEKGTTIEINIVTIDSTIPANRMVSIIQLDVEGYEKEALIGAMQTIKKHQPILILEDNNKVVGTDWFKDNIISQGYEVTSEVHDNTVLTIKKLLKSTD